MARLRLTEGIALWLLPLAALGATYIRERAYLDHFGVPWWLVRPEPAAIVMTMLPYLAAVVLAYLVLILATYPGTWILGAGVLIVTGAAGGLGLVFSGAAGWGAAGMIGGTATSLGLIILWLVHRFHDATEKSSRGSPYRRQRPSDQDVVDHRPAGGQHMGEPPTTGVLPAPAVMAKVSGLDTDLGDVGRHVDDVLLRTNSETVFGLLVVTVFASAFAFWLGQAEARNAVEFPTVEVDGRSWIVLRQYGTNAVAIPLAPRRFALGFQTVRVLPKASVQVQPLDSGQYADAESASGHRLEHAFALLDLSQEPGRTPIVLTRRRVGPFPVRGSLPLAPSDTLEVTRAMPATTTTRSGISYRLVRLEREARQWRLSYEVLAGPLKGQEMRIRVEDALSPDSALARGSAQLDRALSLPP